MTREASHIIISAVILSVAFGIALSGGINAFSDLQLLFTAIWISFIAVAVGFVSHEMAHRYMARRNGFLAEYFMSLKGLGLALVISLTGWIFVAPGAVRIYRNPLNALPPEAEKAVMARISLAGPLTNILFVPAFFIFGIFTSTGDTIFWSIAAFGMRINAWLAVFNLLPLGPLDGRDIFKWNKAIWLIMIVIAAGLYLLCIL